MRGIDEKSLMLNRGCADIWTDVFPSLKAIIEKYQIIRKHSKASKQIELAKQKTKKYPGETRRRSRKNWIADI